MFLIRSRFKTNQLRKVSSIHVSALKLMFSLYLITFRCIFQCEMASYRRSWQTVWRVCNKRFWLQTAIRKSIERVFCWSFPITFQRDSNSDTIRLVPEKHGSIALHHCRSTVNIVIQILTLMYLTIRSWLNLFIWVSIFSNAATNLVSQELLYVGSEYGKLVAFRQLVQQGLKPPVLGIWEYQLY